ncbi:YcxB family protein [Ferruginibacter sp. SUN106]|uniref:YcxB family protein n=1 Tax=Ferruginibacter sp. SUN106 TaxID=2978348 RepID=UPI003D35EC69
MISLRYALTNEDFANFSVYVQIDAPGKKRLIYKSLRPLIIIFSIVCIYNISLAVQSGNISPVDFIGVPIILFLFFFPVLSARPRLRKQALKYAANSENAAVFNMTDYIFSETGVVVKDSVKETKFQWAAFIKKQETPEYIYLFLHSTSALIIPKKMIRSEVEKEQLSKLLSQYISFDAEVGHLVNT